MAYPVLRIAIEYQGGHNAGQYAADVERLERLRSAGWAVIEVTSALLREPQLLAERVRAVIRRRS